jgi:hypothetical protein
MTKITYINEMPYIYDANHARSHYLPNGSDKYKNRGEIIESIAKYHRGIFTESNPNTAWNKGSDIPAEHLEVKSSEGNLGRGIDGDTTSAKIKNYFKGVEKGKKWAYIEWDEKTQIVVEYHMNKSEFGQFVRLFTRTHNMSNHKELCIRLRPTSKKMIKWFEERVA